MAKSSLFTPIQYDHSLLSLALAVLVIGLLLLASASMSISDHNFHQPFHFLLHQLTYVAIGFIALMIIIRIPLVLWENLGFYLLFTSFLLLILVLIPGIGKEVNGSMRWLGVGPVALQISELAKFSLVIFMAGFLTRHQAEVQSSMLGILKPLIILFFIGGLLLLEPDFGAAVVITFTILGMLFFAEAKAWQFLVLLLGVGALLIILAISSPYRMARLTSFLNPWASPFDSGYQLTQSLIAFGRGGIFGVGLGNSIQKLFYLPEAHTDFLFAVLAEELGVIGQVAVLMLFSVLVGRILYLGRKLSLIKGNIFAMYLAYGFGLLLGVQVIINVGVNVGLLPTKGLTLPLMSYGGSSMLFNFMIIAILLRVFHESRIAKVITSQQNNPGEKIYRF